MRQRLLYYASEKGILSKPSNISKLDSKSA
jgi:hypothetical protein